MSFHKDLGDDQIHRIYDKSYANTTLRDADTAWNGLTVNIGKTVFITTTNAVFMLLSITPSWFEFGGVTVVVDTIFNADGDIAANRTIIAPSGRTLHFNSYDLTPTTFTIAADIDIENGEVDIEAKTGDGAGGTNAISRLLINTATMQVLDQINSLGLVYGADYSANFTARSLIDKAYVDGRADVSGPAGATDNALARFNLTTGKLIQNSVAILSDAGVLTGLVSINVTTGAALAAVVQAADPPDGKVMQISNSVVGGIGAYTSYDLNSVGEWSVGIPNNANAFAWRNSGVERMRLKNDGDLDLISGNILMATGKTIDGIDVSVAVPLNTTHRSSDGKNHSDVVLNNTHRTSSGVNHTFINQDVQTTASPQFNEILNNASYNKKTIRANYNPSTLSTKYTEYIGTVYNERGPVIIEMRDAGGSHGSSSRFILTRHFAGVPRVHIQNDGNANAPFQIWYRVSDNFKIELYLIDTSTVNDSGVNWTAFIRTDGEVDTDTVATNDTGITLVTSIMRTKEDGTIAYNGSTVHETGNVSINAGALLVTGTGVGKAAQLNAGNPNDGHVVTMRNNTAFGNGCLINFDINSFGNWSMGMPSADALAWLKGATEQMRLDASGNLNMLIGNITLLAGKTVDGVDVSALNLAVVENTNFRVIHTQGADFKNGLNFHLPMNDLGSATPTQIDRAGFVDCTMSATGASIGAFGEDLGTALQLNGSTGFLSSANANGLPSGAAVRGFIASVRPGAVSGVQTIFSYGTPSGTTSFTIQLTDTSLRFNNGTTNADSVTGIFTQGVYHQVVVTYNGTVINAWVNGAKVLTDIAFTLTTDNTELTVGKKGSGEFFNGDIEYIKIFDNLITDEERAASFLLPEKYNFGVIKTEHDVRVLNQAGELRTVTTHSSQRIVIRDAAHLESLAVANVITVTQNTIYEVDFDVVSAVRFVCTDPTLFMGLSATNTWIYTGGNGTTFIDSVGHIGVTEGFFINGFQAPKLFNFHPPSRDTEFSIDNCQFFGFDMGSLSGGFAIIDNCNFLDWLAPFVISDMALVRNSLILAAPVNTPPTVPLYRIVSLQAAGGFFTIEGLSGIAESTGGLIEVQNGIPETSFLNLTGLTIDGPLFASPAATTGTYTVSAQAAVAATTITSVSSGTDAVARFNYSGGGPVYVGQIVQNNAMTVGAYNKRLIVTATDGSTWYESIGMVFSVTATGNWTSALIRLTGTAPGGPAAFTTDFSIDQDFSSTVFNVGGGTYLVNGTFTANHAGSWDTRFLVQTDPKIIVNNAPKHIESQWTADGFVNGNTDTTTVNSNAYLNCVTTGFAGDPLSERFVVKDPNSGQWVSKSKEKIKGHITAFITTKKSSGADQDYRFTISKNGATPTFASVAPFERHTPVQLKTTPIQITATGYFEIEKGDTFEVMQAGVGTADAIILSDLEFGFAKA